ncbi:MAG: sensor histidine kinase [Rubrivivax sp.]
MRLLLMQGVLVTAAAGIFGLVLAMERNVLLARPYAALWGPVVRQVALQAVGAARVPMFNLTAGMRREHGPPEGAWMFVSWMPGVGGVRTELARQGITLQSVLVVPDAVGLTYFALVQVDGARPFWISAGSDSVLPSWSNRMGVGLAALLLLIVAISRYFVRHVTQPLAHLHSRLLSHAQFGIALPPPEADASRPPPPELLAMDRAYTRLAEQLARNERERALLLAGVSHDLRSPLARIRLAAEMLPETADNADGVAAVTRNVDQADRLIGSFLEFVRTSTQTLHETVDAAAVVRDAVASFGHSADTLCANVPERLLLQNASSLLLARLVVNLTENALKYGGTPVRVELVGTEAEAILTVLDTGPGLPEGGADRLMEAFARGDTSRGVPGFGLGLAIVQQIVTRLQGQWRFENSPAGHQVRVVLPRLR